jgi:predicted site-specific integrase-resolvase
MASNKKSTNPTIEQMTIRVAAYLRYSSHHQDGNTSIDVQRDAITAWAARQLSAEYVDEARSGRNVAKRTALQQLQADALAKQFDVVLVSDPDRLGRNQEEINALRSFLRDDCGLQIRAANGLSAHDGVQGVIYERFSDMKAETYSIELSAKFKGGKNCIWQDGWFIGSSRPPQ